MAERKSVAALGASVVDRVTVTVTVTVGPYLYGMSLQPMTQTGRFV